MCLLLCVIAELPRAPDGSPTDRIRPLKDDTTVLATFTSRHMGETAQGFLLDAGVPAALFTDDAGGMEPPLAFIRPARLVVRTEHVAKAREVLARVYGRPIEEVA